MQVADAATIGTAIVSIFSAAVAAKNSDSMISYCLTQQGFRTQISSGLRPCKSISIAHSFHIKSAKNSLALASHGMVYDGRGVRECGTRIS